MSLDYGRKLLCLEGTRTDTGKTPVKKAPTWESNLQPSRCEAAVLTHIVLHLTFEIIVSTIKMRNLQWEGISSNIGFPQTSVCVRVCVVCSPHHDDGSSSTLGVMSSPLCPFPSLRAPHDTLITIPSRNKRCAASAPQCSWYGCLPVSLSCFLLLHKIPINTRRLSKHSSYLMHSGVSQGYAFQRISLSFSPSIHFERLLEIWCVIKICARCQHGFYSVKKCHFFLFVCFLSVCFHFISASTTFRV